MGNGGVVWARFLARQRRSFLWWSASWILQASSAIGELFRWSAGELSFNPKFLNFQPLNHPYGFGSDTCAALCSLARTFVILNSPLGLYGVFHAVAWQNIRSRNRRDDLLLHRDRIVFLCWELLLEHNIATKFGSWVAWDLRRLKFALIWSCLV